MGNLTRDPEVRYTPKGSAVTDIGLAVNRSYTLDNGERREEVTFVDVTIWGRQAELAGQYLFKGRPVFIEGRLQLDSWEDKNTGEKRNKLRVVCDSMRFIGSRNENQEGGGGSGGNAAAQSQGNAPPAAIPQAAATQAPQSPPPATSAPAPAPAPMQTSQGPPPASATPTPTPAASPSSPEPSSAGAPTPAPPTPKGPSASDLDEEDDIPF